MVLGASENSSRYSYLAANRLVANGHPIIPIGARSGKVAGNEILTGMPPAEGVDTITLYLNPKNQEAYYDYILGLQPRRVIFNPGTENEVLAQKLQENGIETIDACTLVMLSNGLY